MEQNGNPIFLESYNKLNAKFPVVPMGCLAVSFVGIVLFILTWRDLFLNIKEFLKGIKNKKEDTVEV